MARLVIGDTAGDTGEAGEAGERKNSARSFMKWPGGYGRRKQEKTSKIFVSHTSSQV